MVAYTCAGQAPWMHVQAVWLPVPALEPGPADAKVWVEPGSPGTQVATVSGEPGSHGALICTVNNTISI